MEAAGSIVNSFVDLLDEGEQREAVLAAWRGFEVEVRCLFTALHPYFLHLLLNTPPATPAIP
jgi:hypothetical protein